MGDSVLPRLRALAPVMATVSVARGRRRLHTMPTSCGYEIREGESYSWDGLKRGKTPFTVLQHTVSGTGRLLYEGRHHRVGPGDTMLVVVPHDHRYWLGPGERWEYFWLSTTGQEAVAVQRDVLAAAGPVFQLQPATVERIAACCLRLIEARPETPGATSAAAYEAVMALYDDVLFGRGEAGAGRGDALSRAVAHIRADLGGALDVSSLARAAGLSRTRFTRLFAAREGLPPAEFVMRERMTEAARLLAGGHAPVKEVAGRCGFDDPNYFAKAFRRMFGVSPSDFRTTGMYADSRRLESGAPASPEPPDRSRDSP